MIGRALIVDDEEDLLNLLTMTLERMEIQCSKAYDLGSAKQLLADGHYDLCLTDMRLPDGNGIDLVRFAASRQPTLPVAVITAYGNLETAVEAMKAGAFDFIAKPLKLPNLRSVVESALRLNRVQTEPQRPSDTDDALLGSSPGIARVRQMIRKLSRSQVPVCITGESGTGKELAARLIHTQGPRARGAFVPVNCGAVPHDLMESELFGHRKGSFTGAVSDKEGLFRAADGGTLFLDEIAELPLTLQVKLLRAIQEKAIRPVGSAQELAVDARVISATHRDLRAMVERGSFREDLYYRVNVIELNMPPLRERCEDVALIAENLLERIGRAQGEERLGLDPSALTALMSYPFPGNVRELENILQRAATLCEGRLVRADHLLLPQLATGSPAQPSTPEGPLGSLLDQIEQQRIQEALAETRWNRTEAAKRLGMTPRALRYRLKKFGLD
jgi:two-component system, NtrC family, response regulator PilR